MYSPTKSSNAKLITNKWKSNSNRQKKLVSAKEPKMCITTWVKREKEKNRTSNYFLRESDIQTFNRAIQRVFIFSLPLYHFLCISHRHANINVRKMDILSFFAPLFATNQQLHQSYSKKRVYTCTWYWFEYISWHIRDIHTHVQCNIWYSLLL